MILIISLLILNSLGGSFSESNTRSCFLKEENMCDNDLLTSKFPKTAEDLLKVCQRLQEILISIADVRKGFSKDPVRQAVVYLDSMCQEDNPVYKVISSSLNCVARTVRSMKGETCRHTFKDEDWDTVIGAISPFYKMHRSDLIQCLEDVLEFTCKGAVFEHHCGPYVKGAAEDVIIHVIGGMDKCTPETLEDLEPIFQVYHSTLVKKLELQNTH